MRKFASVLAAWLSFISGFTVALPYGCGGTLGVLNVTKGGYRGYIWECAGIDPGYPSLYESGQNTLLASGRQSNTSVCANYCSGYWNKGVNAGVYYANQTCQCWTFGDINTSPSKATSSSRNATFLDFYETGSGAPEPPQKWGQFTCPVGAYHNTVGQNGNFYGACYPLTIVPNQKALSSCPSSGAKWELWTNGVSNEQCYSTFTGVQVYINYSSTHTLVDVYDFTTKTTTAKTHANTKGT